MKNVIKIIILALIVGCQSKQIDYDKIATYQDDSIPSLNLNVTDTSKALLIFPHSDDEIAVGGLVAYLAEKGVKIHLLTLTHHETTKNNKVRLDELNCSVEKLGIEQLEVAGLPNNSWDDIMEDNITFWYDQKDSIKNVIYHKINHFQPDILITFDNELGAYGHPEHRISAQLTEDIFRENLDKPNFQPSILIQFTLPDKLEDFLFASSQGYELSKRLTKTNGLPKPDYALEITKYWEIKNSAAQCHQSQMEILNRFFGAYAESKKEKHKKAFSKEYYTVFIK